jgi:hypothetical protein
MNKWSRIEVQDGMKAYLFVFLCRVHFTNRCIQVSGIELRTETQCFAADLMTRHWIQLNLQCHVEMQRDLRNEKEQIFE